MWQRCQPTESEKTDDLPQDGEGRNVTNLPIEVDIYRQIGSCWPYKVCNLYFPLYM